MRDDGAEVFAYTDITWQVAPPPARYPVPARHVPGLAVGDELTIGLPGRYYIDGQVLARDDRETITLPRETEPRESLHVTSPLLWWLHRGYPEQGLTMQQWPVDYTWVYRDAAGQDDTAPGAGAADRPDGGPDDGSWLTKVQRSLDEPPARRPRPARGVTGLTGRRVRLQHAPGEWSWWYAVSEPVEVAGDISVNLLPPAIWWITQFTYHGETQDTIETLPIHRLFVYD